MSNFLLPRWAGRAVIALVAVAALLVVFRLGTQASAGVALNDPVVWVEDGARGRLLQINGSTQEITAQVDVGDDGDSIVALPQGRNAVFLNRTTGVVGVVGAVSLAVDSQDSEPGDVGLLGEELQLLANYQSNDWEDAFIVGDFKTLVYEPGRGAKTEIRIPESSGALSDTVVNSEGALVAITGDSSQVVYSTDLGLEGLVALPPLISENAARPGLVRAGESVYLVDSARRVINEINTDDELGEGIPICGSPGDVQIAGNVLTASDGMHRVLVHDALAGRLSVVEPGANECRVIELEDTGSNWGAPVAVDGTGYLPNFDSGEIVVVDLVDRVVTDNFRFRPATGKAFELEVFEGAVWANEPDGFRAAIVSRNELVPISKLGNVLFDGEGADGTGDGVFTQGDDDEGPRVFNDEAPVFPVLNGDGPTVEDGDAEGGQPVENPDAAEGEVPNDAETPDPDEPIDTADTTIPPGDGALTPDFIDAGDFQPVQPDDAVVEEVADLPVVDELIANFVFSSDTVNVGEEVRLSDDSTGNPTSWNWSFGDGTSASGPEVSKIWDSEGVFTVTLFAANAENDISEQTHVFTVIAEDVQRVPSAGFTLSSETVEVGESVTFTDASTGDPTALLWDFGDGTTGAGPQVTHEYSAPGIYTVTLTASNEAGPNSVTTQVTVVSGVEPPVAVIAPFSGIVEVGQTVTLVSASTNTPTSTAWSFGDGESELGETVRHAWDQPGEYRIRLNVSNSAGNDETVAVIVVEATVNPPIARFGQTDLTVVQGQELRFSDLSLNAPTSLSWDFGDGSSATGANVAHSWNAPGTYRVTLTATNDAGSDTLSKNVTVDALAPDPPTASFTTSAVTTQVNSVVVFTDTSTGSPTTWGWNFGDGATSGAQSPTHSFDTPGTYTVSLLASNDGGSDTATVIVTVIDPPVASFTFADTDLDVVFADTSANGPTSWAWDFGDGTTSTAQNPAHSYAAPGAYPVTLVASNAAGDSIVFSSTVTVNKAPTADFTFSTGGLTASFADASTDGPTTYEWDFGDASPSSSLASPTHTYAASGTYNVTLTVTNTAGTNSITKPVTVSVAPPDANFTCTVGNAGGVSCDGNTSTSAVTYAWSAPGAIVQTGTTTPMASFTFSTSGNYDITLTVENTVAAADSETQTITVTIPAPPTITAVAVANNANGVVQLAASATNSPTGWTWTTPGGTITAGAGTSSPTISYTTPGPKTVTAVATNGFGNSGPDTTTFTVNISAPPVISAITPTPTATPGVVDLAATVTNTPVTYAWTTSGGTLAGATTATPTLTATANGTYTIGLTVTNGDGSDTSSITVNVTNIVGPPVLSPVNVGAESPAGSVTVSAPATNSPTSWNWSVPGSNEGSSTAASPTFTFPANGPYNGTVTASNAAGVSNQVNFAISINGLVVIPAPTANFTASTTPGSTVATFTFSGTAQAGAAISWSFIGGTPATATGATASSDFTAGPGPYSVMVTVTDGGGSDSFTGSVTIPP